MLGFGALDLLTIGAYLGILAWIAWRSGRASNSVDDYATGGRSLSWWAASLSFMATALSAVSFLGAPDEAYSNNFGFILTGNISNFAALIFVSVFFIPAFYKNNSRTVYDLLGTRFGPSAAQAGSIAFIIGRLLGSGVRLFVASLPLALIVSGGGDSFGYVQMIMLVVMCLVALAIIYHGGIRSVIWTDVVQFAVLMIAAIGTFIFIFYQVSQEANWEHVSEILKIGEKESKLTFIDTRLTADFSIYGAIGITLILIGAYGCDQDLSQRFMTCKDAKGGQKSLWGVIAISIPKDLIFGLLGLALFVYYAVFELTPMEGQKVFTSFIFDQMPSGIKGLAICGLCAAAISGLTSEINALASTATINCFQQWFPGRSDECYLKWTKRSIPIWAAALAVMAILIAQAYDPKAHGSILGYVLSLMKYAYAGLVGVFFCALFTRRGNARSVIAGLIVGFISVMLMGFGWYKISFPWQMTAGTALAFLVACLGTSRSSDDAVDKAVTD